MCDGMRIDRRLVLIGVMLIVLSMTMATQYATTKIGYSFAIVHPSNADIRYIGSDNSSDDGKRVLRLDDNGSGAQFMRLEFGNWAPNQKKNYTAAFGIVNEEPFHVNITHINITGANASYIDIWLYGDRDADYDTDDAATVKAVRDGQALYGANDVIWTLAPGDQDRQSLDGADHRCYWDNESYIQYSLYDTDAVNKTDDYVWVGISLNLAESAGQGTPTGSIYVHFKATTITD